jgi:hypothetical protein
LDKWNDGREERERGRERQRERAWEREGERERKRERKIESERASESERERERDRERERERERERDSDVFSERSKMLLQWKMVWERKSLRVKRRMSSTSQTGSILVYCLWKIVKVYHRILIRTWFDYRQSRLLPLA